MSDRLDGPGVDCGDDGLLGELMWLTPRRRIALGKRHLPTEDVWLIYAVDGAEEARLTAQIKERGMDVNPSDFKGRLLRLNRVGLAIWELCDGSVPIAEVAQEVAGQFDMPQEQVQADVVAFVQELARQDLIDLYWSPL